MRVICIDDNWDDAKGYPVTIKCPAISEINTVIRAYTDNEGDWYNLKAYGPEHDLEQCAFATLSSIDEKTFERNYQTQPLHHE